jgi:glycosyltransferase involved in cell wall biosynthesis
VISHPIQHFSPLFRRLAADGRIALEVFYCCDWGAVEYRDPGFGTSFRWDVDLMSGYDSTFLPIRARPRRLGFFEVDNPAIGKALDRFAPDAIWLHGYSHRTIWRAARWARTRSPRPVRLLHFGDSELVHPRSRWRETLKAPVLRRHFARCDAFITIGDNNEAYYAKYGVPREKMFRGAYPIDLHRFRSTVEDPARPDRAAVRAGYGLRSGAVTAVLAGKLEQRKRPLDFVEAIAIARRDADVQGLIVGDGVLRSRIEQRIRELRIENQVVVTGFVNQAAMPLALEAGDILVTASDMDPHPLVVSEGLAVGLPVIASDHVGCLGPTDSARPGVNALVYRCGDPLDLAKAIRSLALDPALRQRMSRNSLELAPSQDAAVAAEAVARALGLESMERERRRAC